MSLSELKLPRPNMGLNLRRIYLIARRDFLGYVRTWGFWIAVLSPFFGLIFGLAMSVLSLRAEPQRLVTIIDETGQYERQVIEAIDEERASTDKILLQQSGRFLLPENERAAFDSLLENKGSAAGRVFLEENYPDLAARLKLPDQNLKIMSLPLGASGEGYANIETAKAYLTGERALPLNAGGSEEQSGGAALSGILHIYMDGSRPAADYWTTNPNAAGLERYINNIFRLEAADNYFSDTEQSRAAYGRALDAAPIAAKLDPSKTIRADGGGQEITLADNIPFLVAAAFSGILWLAIFSGVYMLLMSMVEEKVNKALEMLLASTRFTEILFGKLLGVVALTLASIAPWILIAGGGLYVVLGLGLIGGEDNLIAAAIGQAISGKMIGFFALFFLLGYIFYGTLFMALGALAESMQDAQTLVTPILLLLTLCLMVVPIGISTPDSPLLRAASFFPPSAPFATLIRLPSEPPIWEITLSAGILFISTIFIVWLSARLFRHGVLSGGGMGNALAVFKGWLGRG